MDPHMQQIRGVFSASDISRKLQLPININEESSFSKVYDADLAPAQKQLIQLSQSEQSPVGRPWLHWPLRSVVPYRAAAHSFQEHLSVCWRAPSHGKP